MVTVIENYHFGYIASNMQSLADTVVDYTL